MQHIEWENEGFKLHMESGFRDADGKTPFKYTFWDGDEIIFEGDDFRAPAGWDQDEAIHSLLSFFALGEGDTDAEYFDTYTDRQIAWRDSDRREVLNMIVYDYENERE